MRKLSLLPKMSLILLALFAVFGARAGDWKSAGLPMQPYEPSYEWEYGCELEIVGTPDARFTRHVAETSFTLSSSRRSRPRLEWVHKIYDSGLRSKTVETPLPFRVDGHRVELYHRQGVGGEDRVIVRLALEERLESKYSVTYVNEKEFRRSDILLNVNVSMTSRDLRGGEHRNESGYLKCTKVR